MAEYDYSEYKEEPQDNLVKQMGIEAKKQLELKVEVAEMEEKLKAKKSELQNNIEFILPDLFERAGLEGTVKIGGFKLPLKEETRASCAKDNVEGMKWLRENGQARLIKTKVVVDFDSMDAEGLEDFKILLKHRDENFKIERSVHSGSLASAVKQLMEEGEDVPQATLHVWKQRTCKVKI